MKDILDKLSQLDQAPVSKSPFEGSILKELEIPKVEPESALERELLSVMEQADTVNEAGFWSGVRNVLGPSSIAAGIGSAITAPIRGAVSAIAGSREAAKFLNTMHSEGMREYGEFYNNIRRTERRDPTSDEAMAWANALYKNDKFEFTTFPASGSKSDVSKWLRDQIMRNRATQAMNPPDTPAAEPEKIINFPAGPVRVTGASGNVYTYNPARPNEWSDQTGRKYVLPADAAVIDQLNSSPAAQAARATPAITGVTPFPKAQTAITTSQGPYVYTDDIGGVWNWYKVPAGGRPMTATTRPIRNPKIVQILNDIAKEQARP